MQEVTWTSDRGGSGTATGTTAWSAAIPQLDGPNRITVAARDPVGNLSQAEVLVTYLPPDTTPPTVGITFPTDAQEAVSTEPQVNLSGEADDDRAVTRVDWASNRGGSGTDTGGRGWRANGIALQPGVNVLSLVAKLRTWQRSCLRGKAALWGWGRDSMEQGAAERRAGADRADV